MKRDVPGPTSPRMPGRLQGRGDYVVLAYALRFNEPGVWMSADECGCVLLYHACALYSGIAEDGDGGGRQGDDVVHQKLNPRRYLWGMKYRPFMPQ
jgi:hypothetical protein